MCLDDTPNDTNGRLSTIINRSYVDEISLKKNRRKSSFDFYYLFCISNKLLALRSN